MQSSLLKNFSFLTLSNVLLPIASMALVVAISRLGGVQLLGEYSYVLTFLFIGQTCTTGGMQILITRDVARQRRLAGTYFVSASAIGVIGVAVVSAAIVPLFIWAVPEQSVRTSILLMSVALLPTVIVSFGEATLLAYERAEDFVVIGFVETLARAATSTLLVWLGYGLVGITVVFLVCRTLALLLIVLAVRRRAPGSAFTFDRAHFTELFRQLPTVGLIPILNALYWRSDTLLLTWLRGMTDVGYYGASTRIIDVTRSLPQAYGRAVYPLFSRFRYEAPEEFVRLCRTSIVWITVATAPLCLTTWTLSGWIVRTMYGAAMSDAANGLAIVAWVMIPYALTSTLAQVLFASGNQVLDLKVNAAALVTNVVLNLILIPRWGFVGASAACLSSISLHVTLQYLYVRRRVCDPGVLGELLRVAGATLAAVAVALALRSETPWGATVAGLGCYLVVLWWAGVIQRAHVEWLVRRARTLLSRTAEDAPQVGGPARRRAAGGSL